MGLSREAAATGRASDKERVYFADARGRERAYGLQLGVRYAFISREEGNKRPVFGMRLASRVEHLEGEREDAAQGRDARIVTTGMRYGGCFGLTWRPVAALEFWFCNGASVVNRTSRFSLAGRERTRWSDAKTAHDQSLGARVWFVPAIALGVSYDWHPSLATFRGGISYAF
jgi:hypothetical protein